MITLTPRGPIMIDILGFSLTTDDIARLKNVNVGGVILFRRNFYSIKQLKQLVAQIKKLRFPELIVAVDQEGGKVQRFTKGFTKIPPMGLLEKLTDNKGIKIAKDLTTKIGFVLACELRQVGIDFSFTPVLDLNYAKNEVIGDRSFSQDTNLVIELAKSLVDGLRLGGMVSCGKHFPGHGFVAQDSHISLPVDNRPLDELEKNDLLPFKTLIEYGIDAIMSAHIVYDKVDTLPTSFSVKWLKSYLRDKLNFQGIVFSDDLNMQGAKFIDNICERSKLALSAGCNIILVCNNPKEVDVLLMTNPNFKSADYAWYKVTGRGDIKNYSKLINTKMFKNFQQEISELYV